jgi:hypothetical protein
MKLSPSTVALLRELGDYSSKQATASMLQMESEYSSNNSPFAVYQYYSHNGTIKVEAIFLEDLWNLPAIPLTSSM